MKILRAIAPPGCVNGACPTFFLTDSGAILIQGARLPAHHRKALTVPSHEEVVSIPREVFDALVAGYGAGCERQSLKVHAPPGDVP